MCVSLTVLIILFAWFDSIWKYLIRRLRVLKNLTYRALITPNRPIRLFSIPITLKTHM